MLETTNLNHRKVQDRKYTITVYAKQYGVILHPDMEGSGFWVECPELDVVSQGETVEESLNMITEAVELHLEDTEGTQGQP
ncbi:MAG: type II toxin-antitoxin system HicB family antitoxin [Nitrospirae bacterium]|nr:type II toxin-antitoxin system HicB family antitoxin [Nitrospirota bacterium]